MTIVQAIAIIVGVLMYALAANPKIVEIGRIMFWTGLLSFLLIGFGASSSGHLPFVH